MNYFSPESRRDTERVFPIGILAFSARIFLLVLCMLFSATVVWASPKTWHTLVLSDTHVLPAADSVTSYYDSDTGNSDLWASAQQEIAQLITSTQPRFVLVLGDLPAHHLSLSDMAKVDDTVFQTMTKLTAARVNAKNRPWFFVPGNNDSLTGDYHSFSHRDEKTSRVENILTLTRHSVPGAWFSSTCSQKITMACVIDDGVYQKTPYYFGYYSVHPSSDYGMRLIVLNSVLWLQDRYVSDDGVTQQEAGDRQMQWLRDQLNETQVAGERVLIAMHVPSGFNSYSGVPYWQTVWQKQWDELVRLYHANIALVVNGHTHMNALRVTTLSDGKAAYTLIVPGITPLHGNNPGMVDLEWQVDGSGQSVWSDATVYASLPKQKSWSTFENYRQAYVPGCNDATISQCLLSVDKTHFIDTLDRYYALRKDSSIFTPNEGWDAVNQAAWEVKDGSP